MDEDIDTCILNNTHYDIANVVYTILKDKHRYTDNTWEYLKDAKVWDATDATSDAKVWDATDATSDAKVWDATDATSDAKVWEVDANSERFIYSIRTIVCRAFTKRSLYWMDIKDDERYPDTEIISNKLLNISSKLKDNKYICVLIKECKQFFVYERDI
jgi:hypothetical protein